MKSWLVDTGPIVAYLAPDDPAHAQVAPFLDHFSGQLLTTSAVLTEAMHLVTRDPAGPRLLADFAAAAGLGILDLSQPAHLRRAVELMERYSDTPMDFADATLLLLAEELSVREILTLDRRGFSTYRTPDGRPLRLVLDRS